MNIMPEILELRYTQTVMRQEPIYHALSPSKAISEALLRAIEASELEVHTGVDYSTITIELKDQS